MKLLTFNLNALGLQADAMVKQLVLTVVQHPLPTTISCAQGIFTKGTPFLVTKDLRISLGQRMQTRLKFFLAIEIVTHSWPLVQELLLGQGRRVIQVPGLQNTAQLTNKLQ